MGVIRVKLFTEREMCTVVRFIGEPFDADSDEFEKVSLAEMLRREGLDQPRSDEGK